jgi:hypothetical protein
MNLIDRATVIHFHRHRIAEFGADSVRALGWVSQASQMNRFETIAQAADFNDSSVLDLGCGTPCAGCRLRSRVAAHHRAAHGSHRSRGHERCRRCPGAQQPRLRTRAFRRPEGRLRQAGDGKAAWLAQQAMRLDPARYRKTGRSGARERLQSSVPMSPAAHTSPRPERFRSARRRHLDNTDT